MGTVFRILLCTEEANEKLQEDLAGRPGAVGAALAVVNASDSRASKSPRKRMAIAPSGRRASSDRCVSAISSSLSFTAIRSPPSRINLDFLHLVRVSRSRTSPKEGSRKPLTTRASTGEQVIIQYFDALEQ